uniref:Histone H2A/H2B/H3 domain-containing protein n=1 Tax=Romanomermis culicivorax TaxID=13658 RepID=A0A915JDC4_ROMCU
MDNWHYCDTEYSEKFGLKVWFAADGSTWELASSSSLPTTISPLSPGSSEDTANGAGFFRFLSLRPPPPTPACPIEAIYSFYPGQAGRSRKSDKLSISVRIAQQTVLAQLVEEALQYYKLLELGHVAIHTKKTNYKLRAPRSGAANE